MSVVKKWGAAICTGFYFVRSNPRTIAIFRDTQARVGASHSVPGVPAWRAPR